MGRKIGIISLGCPKNLVDSEIMLGILKKKDFELTNNKDEADIIIVNTCGFIESAKEESINTILEMAQCKNNLCKLLIVTGCLAERYKTEILAEIPEVDAVVGTANYGDIEEVIKKAFNGEKVLLCGTPDNISYMDNERVLSTGKGFAYLKIAEGCDNCCTYCIIPSLRGRYRSRHMESILNEASRLVESGVGELIIIAQDTTRYGIDLYGERKISELLRKLGNIEGIQWIRLLYCYPDMLDDVLIDEIAQNPKVCKYLDIPVQHASDRILKAMGRRGSCSETEELIRKIRGKIPGVVIRTSVITGFPGEDEADFNILYEFVRKIEFDRLGVFIYSREEGTKAAKMKPHIERKIKKQRHNVIMELQQEITLKKAMERVGKCYRTLTEGISEDGIFYRGRTCAEAPDIDGSVYFTSSEAKLEPGSFVTVKILNIDEYDLIGEVVNESSK